MNTIDLIVCLVLALAVWNGWRKGFIVQAGSLVALVVGLWLALRFGKPVGEWLHFEIGRASCRERVFEGV